MAAITAAALALAFPEWANAVSNTPVVVDNAVAVANAKLFGVYTDDAEDTNRRYLEASAMLFEHAYGRDQRKPNSAPVNVYRRQAREQDMLKGTAERAPGW